MSGPDPYDSVIDRFEALCRVVVHEPVETSRQLLQSANVPKSTGYRALSVLGYASIHCINPHTQTIIAQRDFDLFDAFTDVPAVDTPDRQALTNNPLAIPGVDQGG